MQKHILVIIQSTDSPIQEHIDKGIWERQKFTLTQYAKPFDVLYYTCDKKNMQDIMPDGVIHKSAKITSSAFGVRHVLYYLYLILSAFKIRRLKNAVIRVVGVNVPVIPLVKLISNKHCVISYQFDWANGMKKDYKGIKPMVSGAVQSWVINSANYLFCTTQWLRDIAETRYAFPKQNITIIPNYVNTDVFKPIVPKKKQIVFAGRLHWSKGIDLLINAFNKFSLIHNDYKLIIMGIGEEEQKLKQLAANNSKIEFTGGVNNSVVAKNFNESEIFVLPTINMEGHPKALVEAMAAGCKCVASDVPGNNNVLIDSNSSDLLFVTKDADRLYEKLIHAVSLNNDNQYQFALKNYSSSICFEKEIDILQSFVKDKNGNVPIN
ncbi:MAG: glycosyltransferase family 4 protein [Bacteroidia bacterium]